MNEKKAAAGRPRRLAGPIQVVDPAARYHHELRLPGAGNGPPKPIGRRRADRKQIGWYGFAAQGGCTRITGWDLAADRPTLYRTKGPCSFRNPPSTALSRGPRCLHHARSLGVSYSGEVGPGAIHPSPPRGTEGSNPSPSSGESTNFRDEWAGYIGSILPGSRTAATTLRTGAPRINTGGNTGIRT